MMGSSENYAGEHLVKAFWIEYFFRVQYVLLHKTRKRHLNAIDSIHDNNKYKVGKQDSIGPQEPFCDMGILPQGFAEKRGNRARNRHQPVPVVIKTRPRRMKLRGLFGDLPVR